MWLKGVLGRSSSLYDFNDMLISLVRISIFKLGFLMWDREPRSIFEGNGKEN